MYSDETGRNSNVSTNQKPIVMKIKGEVVVSNCDPHFLGKVIEQLPVNTILVMTGMMDCPEVGQNTKVFDEEAVSTGVIKSVNFLTGVVNVEYLAKVTRFYKKDDFNWSNPSTWEHGDYTEAHEIEITKSTELPFEAIQTR